MLKLAAVLAATVTLKTMCPARAAVSGGSFQPRLLEPRSVATWQKGARHKLIASDAPLFEAAAQRGEEDPLLCQVGATLSAGLSHAVRRKELYEAHAAARLVSKHLLRDVVHATAAEGDSGVKPSHAMSIAELCAGCGLLSMFLALLEPRRQAFCVDRQRSGLASRLLDCLSERWPRLRSQVSREERCIRNDCPVLPSECAVVSCHACGLLSDDVIWAATQDGVKRPVLLLPCCFANRRLWKQGPLPWERWPWLRGGDVNRQGQSAVNDARVQHLAGLGYEAFLDAIDPEITGMNSVVVGIPREAAS